MEPKLSNAGNRATPASGVDATEQTNLWAARIAKMTGALVVVPALLNAAYDVYSSALKLPRTDAERVNSELFKKYFNKPPLAVIPVPIKHSVGIVEAEFQIFEEGEVYVKYGKMSQWFPFPATTSQKVSSWSWLPSAFAADDRLDLKSSPSILRQSDTLAGNVLIRERALSDGSRSISKIDIRSGIILESRTLVGPSTKLEGRLPGVTTFKLDSIAVKR